ncbi:acyl esterase [Pelomyxa schiedti]|nr:acyl esterase [Pelomyxa schiedti]
MKTSFRLWWVAAAVLASVAIESCETPTEKDGPDRGAHLLNRGFVAGAVAVAGGSPACTTIGAYYNVTARDGVNLWCWAATRSGSAAGPAVYVHTPYGIESLRTSVLWGQSQPVFNNCNYTIVVCDWRGRGKSGGKMGNSTQLGWDVHDIIEWIAGNPSLSDGNIGMFGASALAEAQFRGALQNPPHLKCIVPVFHDFQVLYKTYYPGGILYLDHYHFLLSLGYSVSYVLLVPSYNLIWKQIESQYDPADIHVPALLVGGWWDHSYMLDSFAELHDYGDSAIRLKHKLLYGPWIHFATGGATLSPEEDMFVDTSFIIQSHASRFYDRYLRGLSNDVDSWSPIRYLRLNESISEIHSVQQFPPQSEALNLYPHADGTLQLTPPAEEKILSINYVPYDPSPTEGGTTFSSTEFHGPHDQDQVLIRNDYLLFESEPLSSCLLIEGNTYANLSVSTTCVDTDFMVRLVDVYWNNSKKIHYLIGDGAQRLKYTPNYKEGQRNSLIVEITNPLSWVFLPSHSIGIIVTSSNYPIFDRNANTGVDIWADYTVTPVNASNNVYISPTSKLVLPVSSSECRDSSGSSNHHHSGTDSNPASSYTSPSPTSSSPIITSTSTGSTSPKGPHTHILLLLFLFTLFRQ